MKTKNFKFNPFWLLAKAERLVETTFDRPIKSQESKMIADFIYNECAEIDSLEAIRKVSYLINNFEK